MADVHLFQWVAAFAVAAWLTSRWLLTRPTSRWRHIVSGIVTTVLWIPVAYTAGNVHVADGGSKVAFGSQALGTFATLMVAVSIAGLLLGLVLWTEEEAEDLSDALPAQMQRRRPGDD